MKKSILLFLALVFSACSNTNNVAVTSTLAVKPTLTATPRNIDFFNDTTCEAPCVLGITPGLTSEADAREIINNNTSLTNCEEHDQTPQGEWQRIECNTLHIIFDDNMVGWVSFSQPGLTLEQVLQKYGIPDGLLVDIVTLPEEPVRSDMALRYDKIRLEVHLAEVDGGGYEVKPTTPVKAITFYSEHRFEIVMKVLQDLWVGYGIYPPSQ
ncbi:MAG: hypothetical protein AB1750_03345 [Chloroflexota bacterium]